MKIKKPKLRIDIEAHNYLVAHENVTEANKVKASANEAIKQLAESEGTKLDGRVLVTGELYKAGYSIIPKPKVNLGLLKKRISTELVEELFSIRKVEVFDEAKFARLVEKGKISRKIAAKVIDNSIEEKRIFISEITPA